MSKKRIRAVDIARGIAIISIIMGHCGNVYATIFTFTYHVPIFVLLSGYFFKPETSWKDFLINKIKTLLIPYLISCLVIIGLGYLHGYLVMGAQEGEIEFFAWIRAALYGSGVMVQSPLTVDRIGALWFLLALFWSMIFTKLIFQLPERLQPFIVALFYIVSINLAGIIKLPLSIDQGFLFVFYLYIGYLCKKALPLYRELPANAKMMLLVVALLGWLNFLTRFSDFGVVETKLGRGFADILESLCACYCILQFSLFLEKTLGKFTGVLEFLGANSLALLCVHAVELDIYPWSGYVVWLQSFMSPEMQQIAMGLTQVLIDSLIVFILFQFSWFRKLFHLKKHSSSKKQISSEQSF